MADGEAMIASLEKIALAKAHSPRPTNATGTGFVEANDNTLPLRGLIRSTLRLAGRLALTQLRSLTQSGRTVASPFSTHSFLMRQRAPCAVTEIRSAYPLPVCVGHLVASVSDGHQTRERSADVQNLFADFANGHG